MANSPSPLTNKRAPTPRRFFPAADKIAPLDRECIRLGIKLVLASDQLTHGRTLSAMDAAIAELLGWPEEVVGRLSITQHSTLRSALRRRLTELGRFGLETAQRFEANLAYLCARLGLDKADQALIRTVALIELHRGSLKAAAEIYTRSPQQMRDLLSSVTGLSPGAIAGSLQNDSSLFKTGILDPVKLRSRQHLSWTDRFGLLEGLSLQLAEADMTLQGIKTPYVAPMPAASLSLASYKHLRDEITLIRDLLRSALENKARGINVLLYGPPGTGKTELARALVADINARGHELESADPLNSTGASDRLRIFALTQRMLGAAPNDVVVFDEMEDALASDGDFSMAMFGANRGINHRKAWKVSLMESTHVPTIWICNSIWRIDPALFRRFSLCLEVPIPPRSVRLGLLQSIPSIGPPPAALISSLADSERLTPADVGRVSRVLALCPPSSPEEWRDKVLLTLGAMPDGLDTSPMRNAITHVDLRYEPRWINASPGVDDLAQHLRRIGEGRLCFAGPPGTGKTAFAKHLAQQLDRPLLSKKASDLLSAWHGETEKKLAAAFKEARGDNAVLLIDEADNFFQDRRGATHSWEITHVNEALKQLEEHRGCVILCTNLFDRLDPALLRRMDVKVAFGYLDERHRVEVFEAAAVAIKLDAQEVAAFCETARWTMLADLGLGDFAAALRQTRLTSEHPSPSTLFSALCQQLEHRTRLNKQRIGF